MANYYIISEYDPPPNYKTVKQYYLIAKGGPTVNLRVLLPQINMSTLKSVGFISKKAAEEYIEETTYSIDKNSKESYSIILHDDLLLLLAELKLSGYQ